MALVLVSLALITVYFRESSDGTLHSAQRIGVSILTPFEVAGERVSRPFRDAYGWTADLVGAKSDNERLRTEVEGLRTQVIQNQTAAEENKRLQAMLNYIGGARFPEGFTAVPTQVIQKPPNPYAQQILVHAGTSNGVKLYDPVVTEEGLVGIVTDVTSGTAQVRLLTDQESAVSAEVLGTSASGIVARGPSDSSTLVLNRVPKEEVVTEGDMVITSGWQSGPLTSLYPKGIPIGKVSGVSRRDVDLYTRIQVTPLVDFGSLDDVIVLTGGDSKKP
ncbi:MAG: rod shape-determining protein MreC [Gaiellaceae bacterium]